MEVQNTWDSIKEIDFFQALRHVDHFRYLTGIDTVALAISWKKLFYSQIPQNLHIIKPKSFINLVGAFLRWSGTDGWGPLWLLMHSLALFKQFCISRDFGALYKICYSILTLMNNKNNNNLTLLGTRHTLREECQLLAFQAVDTLAW